VEEKKKERDMSDIISVLVCFEYIRGFLKHMDKGVKMRAKHEKKIKDLHAKLCAQFTAKQSDETGESCGEQAETEPMRPAEHIAG
jgi:hypothetical protein